MKKVSTHTSSVEPSIFQLVDREAKARNIERNLYRQEMRSVNTKIISLRDKLSTEMQSKLFTAREELVNQAKSNISRRLLKIKHNIFAQILTDRLVRGVA